MPQGRGVGRVAASRLNDTEVRGPVKRWHGACGRGRAFDDRLSVGSQSWGGSPSTSEGPRRFSRRPSQADRGFGRRPLRTGRLQSGAPETSPRLQPSLLVSRRKTQRMQLLEDLRDVLGVGTVALRRPRLRRSGRRAPRGRGPSGRDRKAIGPPLGTYDPKPHGSDVGPLSPSPRPPPSTERKAQTALFRP